ncbi:glutathione S-transferase family protein [Pseudaquabacterium pictum]|uniref:Glutathione S-transferase n=1 Tax=Pseudaquabacterium pictum TaxID=2315236 RepID=A0A480AUU4_9BURK|nr:glutathione S-transferase family protein [Rubrivivax pictus]GCL63922.1 glutathione S-transferase [Rubrivivax pictus]
MLHLHIGNKNYSSWSMRPWVLLKHFGLPFQEVMHRFDSFDATSRFKQAVTQLSPVGKVPLLVHGDLVVWDTLAIAEYLAEYAAEHFPEHALWPRDQAARARARSLCAEMHSGFGALRNACPMNIEASLPEVGARLLAEQPAVAADLARITGMWQAALAVSGGPFLFGSFGIADAYYAPVVARLRTYALPVPAEVAAYMQRVWSSPGVAAWVTDALAEQEFLDFEEPYRKGR